MPPIVSHGDADTFASAAAVLSANRYEPAVKIVNLIAALLVGILLSVPHAAFAQGLDEAAALKQQAYRSSLAKGVIRRRYR